MVHSVRIDWMVKRLLQNEIAAKIKIDPGNKRSNQDCEYYREIKTEKVEGYQSLDRRNILQGKGLCICSKSILPQEKNTISLPLKPYFKGSAGHSNAIPMNKEIHLHCKK